MEAKFLAWDWEIGEFKKIPSNNIVEAIYIAWNYEFDVYEADTQKLIFSGQLDNEENSALLQKYGIRMIDHNGYRKLQDIESGEIYEAPWH
ncbi:hypothetical protein [Geobacillus thermodenitrificans]|jgi:hypothetical protein|uniref:Phage protein n=1 Tax=Geobacillus thermodenitrificans TaxID=33940 RepID=A0ABY9Q8S9_GEOTD|nr:hypothetical protein [Geobacillus thermodenitrificans]WMV75320.1 hypothetical protein HSX42_13740 [Geobacillus thermodenitrificans]